MKTKTFPFDAAPYLNSLEAQAELLSDAVKSGNASYVAVALETIARSRKMNQAQKDVDIPGSILGKISVSPDNDPRLSTLLDIAEDLGLTLSLVSKSEAA